MTQDHTTHNKPRPVEDPRRTADLVPHIVDYLAETEPDGLFAEYPISATSYDEGYRSITYGAFANAINGLAHWIRDALGPPRVENEVLAYIGPNDLRYPALVLAAIKAGYIIFLTSPRNSVSAHLTLLDGLGCKVFLAPTPRPPQVQAIADAYSELKVVDVPSVNELLEKKFEHFPYEKTFPEELEKSMFVVHTSGSTGFPKPLWYKHGTAIADTRLMTLEPPEGYQSVQKMFEGKRMFMTFPPFHGAYLVVSLFNCLSLGTVFLSPIAGAIPSAEGLIEGIKKSPADIAFIVPSIVLELAQNPEMLDYCAKNLDFVMYCGGDLPQPIGDIVASKIKLINQYGASEIGVCALIQSSTDYDPKDWKYVQFHPHDGHEFRHAVGDTYELYIVHNKEYEAQQPTFTIFPGTKEYATRDLFVRHPTKPDLWAWKARADDIIVFLNGEKTNPISMEHHIVSRNPEVTAALVIGAQRFQAALLLELNMGRELSLDERAAFIEKVWPSIEEANRDCPAHAKIAKTHILFTTPQKPVLRAGKGTIQRAGTLSQFSSEIDALYNDADKVKPSNGEAVSGLTVDLDDGQAVSDYIRKTMRSVASWDSLGDQDSFFDLGLDSLQALLAVRALRQTFKLPTIALSTIYANASVGALASAIIRLSKHHQDSASNEVNERLRIRGEVLKEYQSLIDEIPVPSQPGSADSSEHTVILTGSTGALGSYILATLLSDSSIKHVYCLNRAENSEKLQEARNAARGLPAIATFPKGRTRVTFLTTDFTDSSLGLRQETYSKLSTETTQIIHSAWPVNFNLNLVAFRPSLTSLLSLLRLAASSPRKPHLHYISSISSVMTPSTTSSKIPEDILSFPDQPLPNGYAESKHLSELLLAHAASQLGLSASVSRVGQIAGAVDAPGLWNPAEWFPSLVVSSAHVGAVPESLGAMDRIDWVPIDRLADVLVELTTKAPAGGSTNGTNGHSNGHTERPSNIRVFHPVHPHPTSWDAVRPPVLAALQSHTGTSPEVVPGHEWIARVQKDMQMDGSTCTGAGNKIPLTDEELTQRLQKNPAAKLVGFYESIMGGEQEGQVVLDVERTLGASEKLRGMEGLKKEWVSKWVGEWMAAEKKAAAAEPV